MERKKSFFLDPDGSVVKLAGWKSRWNFRGALAGLFVCVWYICRYRRECETRGEGGRSRRCPIPVVWER